MKAFWRTDELSEAEEKLLTLCLEAHRLSAHRGNISTVILQQAAVGSQDLSKSLSAALLGLGGLHAPLIESWKVLQSPDQVEDAIKAGIRIPGWGNSFEKTGHDPIWQEFARHLKENFKDLYDQIVRVTELLHAAGKKVYPNPSIFTAATGIALQMPPLILPWIFIQGRLSAWSIIFCQSVMQGISPQDSLRGAD